LLYVLLTWLLWPILRVLTRRGIARRPRGGTRLLVVQPAKIGDLVYATPLWHALKAERPGDSVTLLAHPSTAALVARDAALDTIQTVDAGMLRGLAGKWRLARQIRRGRFDVALCLTPSLGLAVGLLWGLVPRVILLVPDVAGVTFRALACLARRVTHRRGEPLAQAYARMAAAAGLTGDMRLRTLEPPPEARDRVQEFLGARHVSSGAVLVGIAPGVGNPVKQWLPERMAALTERILADGDGRRRVVFIGSKEDRELVGTVLECMATSSRVASIDAAGAFDLQDLPALLSRMTLLVSADSGPLHIAETVGVPAVIIGGPADLRERDLRTDHIVVQPDLSCIPCVSAFAAPYACPLQHHRCIGDTTVEEVWAAVSRMLQKLATEAPSTAAEGSGADRPARQGRLP
jgi:ADP-heptose:LPS heptosyltransferase